MKEDEKEKDSIQLVDGKITPNTIGLPEDVRVVFSEEPNADDGQPASSTAGQMHDDPSHR